MPSTTSSPTGEVILSGFPVFVRDNNFVVIIDATLFTESQNNIMLGGQPISLANYNGYHALEVISEAGVQSSEQFVYKGRYFNPMETDYGNAFPVIADEESSIPFYSFVWNGINLATNTNRKMIVVEVETDQLDDTRTFYLGGYPLTACLVGDRWYLLVSPGATDL